MYEAIKKSLSTKKINSLWVISVLSMVLMDKQQKKSPYENTV